MKYRNYSDVSYSDISCHTGLRMDVPAQIGLFILRQTLFVQTASIIEKKEKAQVWPSLYVHVKKFKAKTAGALK